MLYRRSLLDHSDQYLHYTGSPEAISQASWRRDIHLAGLQFVSIRPIKFRFTRSGVIGYLWCVDALQPNSLDRWMMDGCSSRTENVCVFIVSTQAAHFGGSRRLHIHWRWLIFDPWLSIEMINNNNNNNNIPLDYQSKVWTSSLSLLLSTL